MIYQTNVIGCEGKMWESPTRNNHLSSVSKDIKNMKHGTKVFNQLSSNLH